MVSVKVVPVVVSVNVVPVVVSVNVVPDVEVFSHVVVEFVHVVVVFVQVELGLLVVLVIQGQYVVLEL